MALTRHLVENDIPSLLPPRALFLASPWLDLTMSRYGPESSHVKNARSDIFGTVEREGEMFAEYPITALRGPMDFEVLKTNRYFSPVGVDVQPPEDSTLFKGFPETYVTAGGAERMLDDSKVLVEMLEGDKVRVHADFPSDAVHDFLTYTWHEPERTEVLNRVCDWIDSLET